MERKKKETHLHIITNRHSIKKESEKTSPKNRSKNSPYRIHELISSTSQKQSTPCTSWSLCSVRSRYYEISVTDVSFSFTAIIGHYPSNTPQTSLDTQVCTTAGCDPWGIFSEVEHICFSCPLSPAPSTSRKLKVTSCYDLISRMLLQMFWRGQFRTGVWGNGQDTTGMPASLTSRPGSVPDISLLPMCIQGGGCPRTWVHASHVEDQDGVPASWLYPGTVLAVQAF